MERNLNSLVAELKEDDQGDGGIYRGRVLSLLNMVRYKSSKNILI